MGALSENDLYLQHVSVADDLPRGSYVARLPVVEGLRRTGGLSFRAPVGCSTLMAFPGADVLQVAEAGVERVDYRDTEHYQVTRRFLEAPERMLGYLLD